MSVHQIEKYYIRIENVDLNSEQLSKLIGIAGEHFELSFVHIPETKLIKVNYINSHESAIRIENQIKQTLGI